MRAPLLSDSGDVCLAVPEGGMLGLDELRQLLGQALTALSRLGALQDDTKLDNLYLVDNGCDGHGCRPGDDHQNEK